MAPLYRRRGEVTRLSPSHSTQTACNMTFHHERRQDEMRKVCGRRRRTCQVLTLESGLYRHIKALIS